MNGYFMLRSCTSRTRIEQEKPLRTPLFSAMCTKEGVVPTLTPENPEKHALSIPVHYIYRHPSTSNSRQSLKALSFFNSLQQLLACGCGIPLPHHQAFPRAWAGGGPEIPPNPPAQTCSRGRVDSPRPPIVSRTHSHRRPVASVCAAMARS